MAPTLRRQLTIAAAVLLLDVAVTFDNIWPTPAVSWTGGTSIELAAVLILLAALERAGRLSRRRVTGPLAALWMVLMLGRYVDVTAPALYGREINLYYDLRFIPDVAAMVTRVAPTWLILLVIAAVVVVLVLLYRLLRWSWRHVVEGFATRAERNVIAVAAGLIVGVFVGELGGISFAERPLSATPVVATYTRQGVLTLRALFGTRSIPVSPRLESTFEGVRGADVFLVFVESYGAVSYSPAIAAGLKASRQQFASDVAGTGRRVLSALVESPTFGGSSWLAHISLLSGVEVKDAQTNALLMRQPRDTLVKAFARGGFRTIGLMPGLRQYWPEGAFYGFDQIYSADALAYRGPEFGWFALPDQFSLARFDDLESSRPRAPRFVFFPTISTHFPFSPTPPYQPEWSRMLDLKPYDGPSIVRAYAQEPDWTNFTPGYIESMAYDFAVLGGYLRRHAESDLVMILIGDHQPPAVVSGEHAPWTVPVHIIASSASRQAILDRLIARGFREGLSADVGDAARAIGPMNELTTLLLDAF